MKNKVIYNSLHTHSTFSYLDSCNRPQDLAKKAKEAGMSAIALTDHGNVDGLIKTYKACEKEGIKFIPGIEAYMTYKHEEKERKSRHITIIAENNAGLSTIYKLTKIANTPVDQGGGFFYRPRIDFKDLEDNHEGLIILSGCMNSPINHEFGRNDDYKKGLEYITRFLDIIGKDNFFIEMQLVNDPLTWKNRKIYIKEQDAIWNYSRKAAKELGLKTCASNDCHYTNKEDSFAHEILKCIDAKGTLKTPIVDHDKGVTRGRLVFNGFDYHIKSTQDMLEKFTEEDIITTQEIAERCNVSFDKSTKMPLFEKGISDDKAYEKMLKELRVGWKFRKINDKQNKKEYEERIKTELGDIKDAGLANYFLIVWDVLRFCRDNLIPCGPGRGSAAGALTAYLLQITQVDPIKHGLYWERFWNRGRKGSMPDIDVDVSIRHKDRVVQYIKEKFGEDRVFPMMTIGKMESKQALKDVGKAMGLPHSYMNELTKLVPVLHGKNLSIEEAIEEVPELKELSRGIDKDTKAWQDELNKLDKRDTAAILDYKKRISERENTLKKMFEVARKLEGCARNRSVHACALLIADRPVDGIIPLSWDNKKKQYITGLDMYDLEDLGFLKLDILGLKTLDVIADSHPDGALCLYDPEKYFGPWDDPGVYDLFAKGRTKGVFQLESPLGKTWCKKVRPQNQQELSDLVALIRPAVLEIGMADDYLKNRQNKDSIEYIHKDLKPILEKTHGIQCIHEDTYVSMSDGTEKKIKDISLFDKVQSLDISNNTFVSEECHGISLSPKTEGIKIRLQNGYQITLTKDHKVLTQRGFVEVQHLENSDTIAIALKQTNEVIENMLKDFEWMGDEKSIGYLIGQLVGDGCSGTSIASGEKENHDNLLRWLQNNINLEYNPYFNIRSWYIGLSTKELLNNKNYGHRKTKYRHFIEQLGLEKTKNNKIIDNKIFLLKAETRRAFLAGLFDADGHSSMSSSGHAALSYCSENPQIINAIRKLLAIEGIKTYIDPEQTHLYVQDGVKFKETVGPYLVLKKFYGKLTSGPQYGNYPKKNIKKLIKSKSNTSIKDQCKVLGVGESTLFREKDHPFVSCKIAEVFGLSFNDILFSKVVSTSDVDNQKFYSIAVSNHHNLVGNGIVISNCYQEQMIELVKTFAGFSLEEADNIRRIAGKKKIGEMEKIKPEFIKGVTNKYNNEKLAEELWAWIEQGASYLFNRSHSVAYGGFLGYITAYMKVHYPAQFILSLLKFSQNEQDSHNEVMELYYDARLFGIEIRPPSILRENIDFELDNSKIYFGLSHIKHIGQSSIKNIKNMGNVSWLRVLLDRKIKKDVLIALILSGSFDDFGLARREMRDQYRFVEKLTDKELVLFEKFINGGSIEKTTKKLGSNKIDVQKSKDFQQAVVNLLSFLDVNDSLKIINSNRSKIIKELCGEFLKDYIPGKDFGPREKAGYESYYLGVPLTCSETDIYKNDNRKTHELIEIEDELNNIGCSAIVLVNKINERTDKRGREMAFIGMQDKTYQMDGVIFSSDWLQYSNMLELGKIVLVQGKKNRGGFQITKIEELQ